MSWSDSWEDGQGDGCREAGGASFVVESLSVLAAPPSVVFEGVGREDGVEVASAGDSTAVAGEGDVAGEATKTC